MAALVRFEVVCERRAVCGMLFVLSVMPLVILRLDKRFDCDAEL